MEKQSKSSQLTLAGILLAVFVILHILPGGQKTVQGFMMILTFLPLTIYSIRYGTKKTLIMAAVGCIICALLLTPEVLLSFAIPALIIGVVGGMCYGKCKRLIAILIFSVLNLLQNVIELFVYYLLSGINFMETYLWAVDLAYEKIPDSLLNIPLVNNYVEDLMICAVPCLAILGAGAKGIISFFIIKLIHSRLTSVMGPLADPKYTQQTKFNGKGISIAYFCIVCVCAITAVLPFLSIIPYHFICAAAAAMGILLAIIYFYYFYINRVRTQEDRQKRLIYSFLMMALLPINIFALPLLEIHLLKKEAEEQAE